ncbi:lmo0937 family membrane protein [Formosa algae]|uniref:Lmo0937 family membrane protein n=1 Tax=Formosa algae TaxID=225843 RepID=A0A9X1CBX8_9FLAO|nr:lmo0937 family membrane protein [Formosa algae]MBP1840497.1 hypothetical protein [Formosa algae]MDQ0336090.1 hypothetical protein [Formosa algae]
MRNILWLIALICIVTWILGFFGVIASLTQESLTHVLLVVALMAISNNLIDGRRI